MYFSLPISSRTTAWGGQVEVPQAKLGRKMLYSGPEHFIGDFYVNICCLSWGQPLQNEACRSCHKEVTMANALRIRYKTKRPMPGAATQMFTWYCSQFKNGVYTLVVKITTQGGEGQGPESWEVLKGLLLTHGGDRDNWRHSNKPRRKEGCCGVTGRNASCHCLATWVGWK